MYYWTMYDVPFMYDFERCTIGHYESEGERTAKSTPLRPRTYGDPATPYYHQLSIKAKNIPTTDFMTNS